MYLGGQNLKNYLCAIETLNSSELALQRADLAFSLQIVGGRIDWSCERKPKDARLQNMNMNSFRACQPARCLGLNLMPHAPRERPQAM